MAQCLDIDVWLSDKVVGSDPLLVQYLKVEFGWEVAPN